MQADKTRKSKININNQKEGKVQGCELRADFSYGIWWQCDARRSIVLLRLFATLPHGVACRRAFRNTSITKSTFPNSHDHDVKLRNSCCVMLYEDELTAPVREARPGVRASEQYDLGKKKHCF
jgi:hypothetical protein